MELDKLSKGEKISAVSAILLFIFMFFDWFGAKVSGVSGFSGTVEGGGGSAWDALDIIPIFLLAAIVVALAVAVIRLTDADIEPPFSLNTAGRGARRPRRPADPLPDHQPARRRRLRRRLEVDITLEDLDLRQPDLRRGDRLRRLQRDARGRDDLRRRGRPALGPRWRRRRSRWRWGRTPSAAPSASTAARRPGPRTARLPGAAAPQAPPAPEQPVQPPPPPPPPQAPQEYAPPPPQQQPPPPPPPAAAPAASGASAARCRAVPSGSWQSRTRTQGG